MSWKAEAKNKASLLMAITGLVFRGLDMLGSYYGVLALK